MDYNYNTTAMRVMGLDPPLQKKTTRRMYIALARKLHPDRKGGNTAKFQELEAAYSSIKDRDDDRWEPPKDRDDDRTWEPPTSQPRCHKPTAHSRRCDVRYNTHVETDSEEDSASESDGYECADESRGDEDSWNWTWGFT